MHYLVYRITNSINGKSYIGCHKTHDKDDGYMGSGTMLKRAHKKYGIENFKKEILFEASSSGEMFTKEKELVVLGPGSYNINAGGHGGFDFINKNGFNYKGFDTVAERNAAVSPFKKGHGGFGGGQKSVELKRGIHNPDVPRYTQGMKGKHHSDAAKEKISAANSILFSGSGNPNYGKRTVHSPETRAKLSVAAKEFHRKRKLEEKPIRVSEPS
jgi:NUMOD3 motif